MMENLFFFSTRKKEKKAAKKNVLKGLRKFGPEVLFMTRRVSKEFFAALKKYRLDNCRWKKISFKGSGELEFEEFCILAARFLIEEDEEQMRRELKEAFRFYDKDGEGFLTIETLKGILLELEPNLGDDQLMEIVEEVDEDGSGTIDFDGISLSLLTLFHCFNLAF